MNTTAVVVSSIIAMIVVLIGTVYAGIYFGKKSAEKRRKEMEEKRN